ncbi:MAG: nucleotidyltransferase domain-containing protein [Ktedonobacteraceae bacterium]|nr:nucleotidyltransferase domain-containing protein [Ktedonobacteraceae bacterium]
MYEALLQEIVDEARKQQDIIGILLTGSVARGDALPGTDLDLRFILTPGTSRNFQSELRQGIQIEQGYADVALAQSKLATNPMEVYPYLDGRILFDPVDVLQQLREQARERFETYRTPEQERHEIAHNFQSALLKMNVALQSDDLLKAAFVASTTSWITLVGLWAVNDKPMPPNSSVWAHLKDLSLTPPDVETLLKHYFCGEARQRVEIAINLTEWVLAHLS